MAVVVEILKSQLAALGHNDYANKRIGGGCRTVRFNRAKIEATACLLGYQNVEMARFYLSINGKKHLITIYRSCERAWGPGTWSSDYKSVVANAAKRNRGGNHE